VFNDLIAQAIRALQRTASEIMLKFPDPWKISDNLKYFKYPHAELERDMTSLQSLKAKGKDRSTFS
jgi:hypothetical protein